MRSLVLLLAVGCLAFLVPACGDAEETHTKAQTPYGTTPYAAGSEGGAARGIDAELAKKVDAALAKGRKVLLSAQQENGSFGDPETGMPPNVGYTSMAVAALVGTTSATEVAGDPAIRKGLEWLASQQKEDGSIWDNPQFVNYMTSAAVGAFAIAKIPAFRKVQAKGMEYLVGSQIASDQADPSYGGFPYKQKQGQPADLSNVQFAVTALRDAGLPADSPVWERLRVYLSRVQNRSEGNDYVGEVEIEGQKAKVVSGDDGGAFYYPGHSKADYVKRADGAYEPRSYGSMTYALLKCLLMSGVDVKDPRIVGALGWLTQNFTVKTNPGFETAEDAVLAGQQGWYYYAYTMARTLAEYERYTKKQLEVKDRSGTVRNWRAELAAALLERRREDGSWVNAAAERWDEGAPILATSYALRALADLR